MNRKIGFGLVLCLFTLGIITFCTADDINRPLLAADTSVRAEAAPAGGDSVPPLPVSRTVSVRRTPAAFNSPDTLRDVSGIESTLTGYRNGFEAMDMQQILKAWPQLDRQRKAAFQSVFQFLQKRSATPRIALECSVPARFGSSVSMDCSEAVSYVDGGRGKTVGPVRVAILLTKHANEWTIQSMKGL
jgi:hypothetical protein